MKLHWQIICIVLICLLPFSKLYYYFKNRKDPKMNRNVQRFQPKSLFTRKK